jgi:L-seryl-tRNA(Ser) seleniumtransferase
MDGAVERAQAAPAGADAALRTLPSVDRVASDSRLVARFGRVLPVTAARAVLESARDAIRAGEPAPMIDEVVRRTASLLEVWTGPGPAQVINATGVILHTNLGRAPLSPAARDALLQAAGYCSLEFDIQSGTRRSRQEHVRPLLRAVSGAEDGMAVTNNAAALFLVLAALCTGREVLVSRGEAVAIGDGFRIPTIVEACGVRLVDVGTTNRTGVSDYEGAISERTAAILRVHASNFTMRGFTERPTTAACAALARRRGLVLIEDAGSGRLSGSGDGRDGNEPLIRDLVDAGAHVVTCSADKLCGGPQAGLVFSSATIVERLRRHPVSRVVRPDKLVIAALCATLAAHVRDTAAEEVPALRMLGLDVAEIGRRARRWCAALQEQEVPVTVRESSSAAGGGAMPETELPSMCLTIADADGTLARALARHVPAIIARTSRGHTWLDPRTVDERDDATLVDAVVTAWRMHGFT